MIEHPWLFFKRNGGRISRFILTERLIGVGEKLIEVLMIALIIKYGVIEELLIATPIYFFFCVGVVKIYDHFLSKGMDLLGIEYLRGLRNTAVERKSILKRFARWIMKRRTTIFWLGSIFRLDPDVVTLLLREDKRNTFENSIKITLPSVVLSMVFWTMVFKLGIMGFKYFTWFVQ
jgi:hypothetical protein